MSCLSRLLSLVLLTAWFAGTQHCELAVMGVIPRCSSDCVPRQPCPKDGCDSIENGAYRSGTDVAKVPAPVLVAPEPFVFLHAALSTLADRPVVVLRESFERPLNWVTTWRFVQRAAPPSRAPTLLCA